MDFRRAVYIEDQFPQNTPNQGNALPPPFAYQMVGVDVTPRLIRAGANKKQAGGIASNDMAC
jgi:hypothetical protein